MGLRFPKNYAYLNPICLGRGTMCPLQFHFEIKQWKHDYFSLLVVWEFQKFIQEHEENKSLNFWLLTWPFLTSSNLRPFFHGQTLINWKCFNFFKNQYFWTKFGHMDKCTFLCLKHIQNKKLTVFANFIDFPIFPIPKNPILDHLWT